MAGSKLDPGWTLQRQERLPSQAAAGAGWRISDQRRSVRDAVTIVGVRVEGREPWWD